MIEQAIELHDSALAEIAADGANIVFYLRPAYIHRRATDLEGDGASGWTQDIDLTVRGATVWPRWPTPEELPSWLTDGSQLVGSLCWDRLIPLSIAGAEPVEFRVEGSGGLGLTIRGIGVQITTRGEARYVEPSPWRGW